MKLHQRISQVACNPDSSATIVLDRDAAQLLAHLIGNARAVVRLVKHPNLALVDLANTVEKIEEHGT